MSRSRRGHKDGSTHPNRPLTAGRAREWRANGGTSPVVLASVRVDCTSSRMHTDSVELPIVSRSAPDARVMSSAGCWLAQLSAEERRAARRGRRPMNANDGQLTGRSWNGSPG